MDKSNIKNKLKKLDIAKKKRLVLTLLLLVLPLFIYIFYCALTIVSERIDTIDKYIKGSDESEIYDKYDSNQVAYHSYLENNSKEKYDENKEKPYYCIVKVGAVIERIKSISSSTSNYEARIQLFFYFDKNEFQEMFKKYASEVLWDSILNDYYNECDAEELEDGRDVTFSEFIENKKYKDKHALFYENWIIENDHRFYPGEAPSNVLVDNETMFEIGNGEFVPDSYGTIKSLEEIKDGEKIICYQKVKFTAKFEKYFNSVRYPLDSVQFKMYILPIMDSKYIRYIPNRDVNIYGDSLSGFSPYFGLTDGYRLIKENSKIKNFSLKIHYYKFVSNEPTASEYLNLKTELEIIVRANRAGIQLFLQAFINLFSVLVWISIAFYNQTFNKKNSMDMLGTGLFGAISSMIIGLSLISDAGMFSLITMNNIFTLVTILMMTYLSIAYQRFEILNNQELMIYHEIKLRIMFYVFMISIVIMFIGLPLLSYMFGL